MNRLRCPQCGSLDVEFYDGWLGYEGIRCNTCNQETDANRPESYCERTDRAPLIKGVLTDLCHHAEYRIYVNGKYVESVGSRGTYAQGVLEGWKRARRRQSVVAVPTRCNVPGCGRGQQ